MGGHRGHQLYSAPAAARAPCAARRRRPRGLLPPCARPLHRPGLVLVASALALAGRHAAGPPAQPDAAQIALGLRKLGVVGSVLYVAAHPDDENTALLAYLANGALVRTGYLSITRGDGGQNLIGSEQGPALGSIRTQELLAARRIDGAEQFFTRARDFGFSKSPDETLQIWGKDAVLADVVAVIRRFRPDVIVTRFSPEPADTHGHHTASAMLAVEAFQRRRRPAVSPRAAHRRRHALAGAPDHLEPVVVERSSRATIWPGYVKLDVGGYNALLGASYGEIAADSRSMHKSQGFGVARSRAARSSSTFSRSRRRRPTGAGKAKRCDGILDGRRARLEARSRAARRSAPLVARGGREFDPAAPAGVASPRWSRSTPRSTPCPTPAGARRSSGRSRDLVARLRGALRRRDRRRLPRRAGRRRRDHRDRRRPLARRDQAGGGALPVRRRHARGGRRARAPQGAAAATLEAKRTVAAARPTRRRRRRTG